MAVFTEEVDIGDMAAVSTVDVAWSLEKYGKEESLDGGDGRQECLHLRSVHNSLTPPI